MFIAIFTLICASVAAAGIIALFILLDDLRAELSRVAVYTEELSRKINDIAARNDDLMKLQRVLKEYR